MAANANVPALAVPVRDSLLSTQATLCAEGCDISEASGLCRGPFVSLTWKVSVLAVCTAVVGLLDHFPKS